MSTSLSGRIRAKAALIDPNSYGRYTDKSLETLSGDKAKEILPLLLEWHAKNKEAEA